MKKLNDILTKRITPKTVSIILTLVYIVSLIPLLVIARYNYPSADDYSIGETCRHAWTASHNIFAVIWQAVLMAVHDYFNWMGYFSSIFFMSIHPGVFGEQYYALTAWIMIGMLSFSTMYLFHAIMVKALKMDKYLCRSISMMVLFVMVQCMVGRVEAFYWFCGAVNYIFLHSAGMFMLGAMLSAAFDEKKSKRIWDLILASIMGVWAGAGNYMTALNICILLFVAAGLLLYSKLWKRYKTLLIPMGAFLISFLASVLAPGNNVRAEGASGMNPIKAVFVSFYYALDFALSDWTNWVVILLVIVLIPLFWKAAGQTGYSFRYPLIVAVFSYCLLSAMVTPPLFAVGNIEAGRLQALIFVMYLLLLTLNVGYVTGWVYKRRERNSKIEDKKQFSVSAIYLLVTCGAFLIFGSLLCVIPEPHYFAWSSAITDLANGSAKAYGNALSIRSATLNDPESGPDLSFEPLPAQPALLYYQDITTEPDNWENRAVARYYGKKSVVIRKE